MAIGFPTPAVQRHLLWDRCTAGFLAAESDKPVTTMGPIHALQCEYQKLGRLTLVSELGPYMSLLTT
ncbi:hypothetical protein [Streptomyces sp. Inha503]|uniref:hypothetical protein n=1 Tax=Streptomyces sp. Inha503 TaxID=3383314 RepID=UPI0039A324A6